MKGETERFSLITRQSNVLLRDGPCVIGNTFCVSLTEIKIGAKKTAINAADK